MIINNAPVHCITWTVSHSVNRPYYKIPVSVYLTTLVFFFTTSIRVVYFIMKSHMFEMLLFSNLPVTRTILPQWKSTQQHICRPFTIASKLSYYHKKKELVSYLSHDWSHESLASVRLIQTAPIIKISHDFAFQEAQNSCKLICIV